MGSVETALGRADSNSSDERVSSTPSSWQAELSLRLAKTSRGTRLMAKSHTGPLYVQKPFYPEGKNTAHIYLLHPPGGIVSGDNLVINIDINERAHGLFTTPGAGRIYKARADLTVQSQSVELTLDQNAVMEWLPLETIIFPASNGRLTTRVNIPEDASGRFIGWEITALGLPASEFPFNNGQLRQTFELYQGTRPLLIETLRLNAKDDLLMQGMCGLQGQSVSALMVAGPFHLPPEELKQLMQTLRNDVSDCKNIGITCKHQLIIIRLLSNSAEQARKILTQLWRILRPTLIELPVSVPRIWAC